MNDQAGVTASDILADLLTKHQAGVMLKRRPETVSRLERIGAITAVRRGSNREKLYPIEEVLRLKAFLDSRSHPKAAWPLAPVGAASNEAQA